MKSGEIFCSYELHSHKLEPQIYLEVARIINIKPEFLLFVDDMERNVIGAQSVGIDTILAKNPAQILNEMIQRGVFE